VTVLDIKDGVIDLRYEGKLPVVLARLASQIEAEVRDEYTNFVGTMADANNIAGVGWLVNVTCRNPYQTKIFDSFCKLKLLDRCLQEGYPIDVVKVDKGEMEEAVESLRNRYTATFSVVSDRGQEERSGILWEFWRMSVLIYISLISFVIPRVFNKKKKLPKQPIIYLDTFIKSSDFTVESRFVDRYYPGLLQAMEHNVEERTWYAPVVYSIRSPFDLKFIFDCVERSGERFLLMEQWLKAGDYLSALVSSYLLPRQIRVIPSFCGIDVSKMVKSESISDRFSTSLFGSLLRYKFISRLRQAGVEIDTVIDWNENQVIDRALCLAVRDFYPGVRIIGYQGFIVSEHYLSHEPTCYERDAGTVPDTICVINQALVERKKKYCVYQPVTVAPAFRFEHLIDFQSYDDVDKDIVLLALPVQIYVARMIIQLCLRVLKRSRFCFQVKLHPTITELAFLSEIPEANNPSLEFTNEPLETLFPHTALLISADSSACYEAALCGIHVAVVGNRTGPTSNPLDGIISSDCWKVCYDSNDLLEILDKVDQPFNIDNKVRPIPVTHESIEEFLFQ